MKIYGEKPRPRALLLGLPYTEAQTISQLFPTAKSISDMHEVRQDEWDLLVTREGVSRWVAAHLFVLAVGGDNFGRPAGADFPLGTSLQRLPGALGSEIAIPSGLPPEIERAVLEDLRPKALAESAHGALSKGDRDVRVTPGVVPFLQLRSGAVLAGAFARVDSGSHCWVLPSDADLERWIRLAIQQWRNVAPDRFPRPWSEEERWLTSQEVELVNDALALEQERRTTIASLDSRSEEVAVKRDAAAAAAAAGMRRLLTAGGDELASTVQKALEDLGFQVRNMDAVFPSNDRREDLRVQSRLEPGWEAIVEVRSYAAGAQANELLRIERHARRYRDDEGHDPSVCWYVVNHFTARSPSDRPQLLDGGDDYIRTFEETRPIALIDSRTLFLLIKAAQQGRITSEQAQQILIDTRGRLNPEIQLEG